MTFILCFTQVVVCAALSPDCTDIVKHGQMKGRILATHRYTYTADFTDAAKYKNFEGDFENVDIDKDKCIKYNPEEK